VYKDTHVQVSKIKFQTCVNLNKKKIKEIKKIKKGQEIPGCQDASDKKEKCKLVSFHFGCTLFAPCLRLVFALFAPCFQ
jgi:hypothetical protein